jgi:pyrroline-5-carboxylate reductase
MGTGEQRSIEGLRLAVIGTGKMAGALAGGWLKAGVLTPGNVRLYNRTPEKAARFAEATGCVAVSTPQEAVTDADILLLGVKPFGVVPALEGVRDALPPGCLVVSVAAGVRTATMEAALRPETPVVRVMPNTPALVGAAASAYCRGAFATTEHAEITRRLFSAVGETAEIAEEQMDAILGISSSGVAYFYLIIEALSDGGVRAGLPRDIARQFAAQTALGAARMILETGEHPAALKDAVTTPAGTTIAALEVLEAAGLRGTLIKAVLAARDRARELG